MNGSAKAEFNGAWRGPDSGILQRRINLRFAPAGGGRRERILDRIYPVKKIHVQEDALKFSKTSLFELVVLVTSPYIALFSKYPAYLAKGT